MAQSPQLNDRAQHFLKILVERYIADGQPIGSRTLAKDANLSLSPATIRNVMSDLEDMGLIVSPHTSSGRVPTVNGYRMFVDSLLTLRTPNVTDVDKLKSSLSLEIDSADLIESASNMLSGLTSMAGIVTLPRHNKITLKHVEFLNLSHGRVLAILVTSDGEVHNRILHTQTDFSASQLVQAGNYMTQSFQGFELTAIRKKLMQQLSDAKSGMDVALAEALTIAGEALQFDENKDDYILAGQTNLMGISDLSDMGRLRQLFEAFTHKREMLHLLDQCMSADSMQIFIGEESGYQTFSDCSLITAPYQADDNTVGVLGVIGPTRMAYDRVIPIVDITAKILGAALKQQ